MALWDIQGKFSGQPVRRLRHTDAGDAVPCYASVLWPDRPKDVAASARCFVDAGYLVVKSGWGSMGPDLDLDEELVAATRDALFLFHRLRLFRNG